MNARATFPQLPLDDAGPGFANQQYRRLFGNLSPDQVMITAASSSEAVGAGGSSSVFCDPSQMAGHPFSGALLDVAALRAQHMAKGHTPETDAAHGPLFFWHGAQAFFRSAQSARDPATRRKRYISAAAMLAALIDCHDFQTQQEQTR